MDVSNPPGEVWVRTLSNTLEGSVRIWSVVLEEIGVRCSGLYGGTREAGEEG